MQIRAMVNMVILVGMVFYGGQPSVAQTESAPAVPSAAQLMPYAQKGGSFIEGTVIANTRRFGRRVFRHATVTLVPYTDYGLWFTKMIAHGLDVNSVNHPYHYPAWLSNYSRDTVTDDNGYFMFANLPEGRYLLTAIVDLNDVRRPLERRTETGVDQNGDYVNVPVQTRGLTIHQETDELSAAVSVSPGRGARVDEFGVLGASLCCKAHV